MSSPRGRSQVLLARSESCQRASVPCSWPVTVARHSQVRSKTKKKKKQKNNNNNINSQDKQQQNQPLERQ